MKVRLLSLLLATALAIPPVAATAQQPVPAPVRLSFRDAPLSEVVRSIAASLGLTAVLSEVPDRRISFATAAPVAVDQLPGILESILEANGLVLVRKGSVAQVMPSDQAPATGEVRTGRDFPDPPPLGLVTQLVQLEAIRAEEGAEALKQVASPIARIEAVARSNSLLITDRGVNIARYLELLRALDQPQAGEQGLRTFVVPLHYANAEDLANTLGQVFDLGTVSSRGTSLADRSLSSALDVYRAREAEAFRTRLPMVQPLAPRAAPATADTTAPQAGALVGRTTVVPDPPSNSLIIRTAPPNFPLLQETIRTLDTRPPQVLFEVTVAEIVLGNGQQFGVDWRVEGGSTVAGIGNTSEARADSARNLGQFVMRVVTLDKADVQVVLRALASKSQVRVLSTPELLAVNNREARILVGSKVPFIASTRLGNDVAIDRTVQYENVGTALTIIPTINEDDFISVQILQEVSALTSQTIEAALNAPVITTREATTRAVIRDGQTVVIGGLIGTARDEVESGVPFFKDIPLLGYLFKRQTTIENRTELAIFVTPYIVRSEADADLIRERVKQRMNEKSPGTLPDTIPQTTRKP